MTGSKAVLWDMDGTLVDSEELHWIAWRTTMANEGIAPLLSPVVPVARGRSSCAIDLGMHFLTAAVVAVSGVSIALMHFPLSGQWRFYAWLLSVVLIALVFLAAVAVASRWRLMGNAARAIGRLPQLHNWIVGKEPTIHSAEHNLLTFRSKAPAAFWASLFLSLL